MKLLQPSSILSFALLAGTSVGVPAEKTGGYCLVLEDEFNDSLINPKTWKHDITMGGGGNWEFEWYCLVCHRVHLNPSMISYFMDI